MSELESANYTAPTRECDIVMKGGVTSGVVYPEAVMELARTYRFRAVGGTSAGAIAAAGAAAAELGRSTGGFERLAELPGWIARDGNLASLFQAQRRTQPLLAVLLALTQKGPASAVGTAVAGFPVAALAGAVPGLALAALALTDEGGGPGLTVVALVCAVALLGVGTAAAIGWAMWRRAFRAIPANGFGLCSGMPGVAPRSRPALTPWLTELIDHYAGRDTGPDAPPLTFGDLARGPEDGEPPGTPDKPWLRLEMVTTNVTNRQAGSCPGREAASTSIRASCGRCSPNGSCDGWRRTPRRFPTIRAIGSAASSTGSSCARCSRSPRPAICRSSWRRG